MRIVVDTNLMVSALIAIDVTTPLQILDAWWKNKRFDLVSSEEQIAELTRVTQYGKLRHRLVPSSTGTLINRLRTHAVQVTPTPDITASPDPKDNYLLGMAQAGVADYLVSGDKRDVLSLGRWQHTRIVTARQMAALLKL